MLTIQFNNPYDKKQPSTTEYTCFLRRNTPLILSGNHDKVEHAIAFIKDLKGCTFTQGEQVIDHAVLSTRIAHFNYETKLPSNIRVSEVLKPYKNVVDLQKVCMDYGLTNQDDAHIKHLSHEEKVLLQMHVYLLQKPFLWVFDGTWNIGDKAVLDKIKMLLQNYLQEQGCYIIATEASAKLFGMYDTYDLDNLSDNQPYTNYLEENVSLRKREIKVTYSNYSKIFYGLKFSVFLILIFLTTCVGFLYFFIGQTQNQNDTNKMRMMDEASSYPIMVEACNNDRVNGCEAIPMDQVDQILRNEFQDQVYSIPQDDLNIDFSDNQAASYFMDDENKQIDIDYSYGNTAHINIFNKDVPLSLGVVKKQFHEEGIYISESHAKQILNGYDLSKVKLHMKLWIPIYQQPYPIYNQEEGIEVPSNVYAGSMPLYKEYDIEMPIAGVVDSFSMNGLYLEQSVYNDMKAKLGYGKPFDESQKEQLTASGGWVLEEFGDVITYYPTNYLLVANNIKAADDIFYSESNSKLANIYTIYSYYKSIEDGININIEMQKTIRAQLQPILLISTGATILMALWLRYKQRKNLQILTSKKVIKQLGICVAVGSGIGILIYLLLSFILAMPSSQPFIDYLVRLSFTFGGAMLDFMIGLSYLIQSMEFTLSQYLFLFYIPILFMLCAYVLEWIKNTIRTHK